MIYYIIKNFAKDVVFSQIDVQLIFFNKLFNDIKKNY